MHLENPEFAGLVGMESNDSHFSFPRRDVRSSVESRVCVSASEERGSWGILRMT